MVPSRVAAILTLRLLKLFVDTEPPTSNLEPSTSNLQPNDREKFGHKPPDSNITDSGRKKSLHPKSKILSSKIEMTQLWPYVTPGIPDDLFEQLPGIPLSQKEVRLLLISAIRMQPNSVLWDIGAGTGTIPVETGLLCPDGKIMAIERDEEVANLIRRNCDRFGVRNVQVIEGSAPECLKDLPEPPQRVFIEGGRLVKNILKEVWRYLEPTGRVVATASNLESLYAISEGFAELQARNIEVVQSAVNRLETRGHHQRFAPVNPIFILSGEKLD